MKNAFKYKRVIKHMEMQQIEIHLILKFLKMM